MSATTVREMVRDIQVETRSGDLPPDRAAQLLLTLTSLLGNCGEEIREADYQYSLVLLKHFESGGKANRARIQAETTPEFQRKQEARDTRELVVELIRSLKYVLRAAEEEMRLTQR